LVAKPTYSRTHSHGPRLKRPLGVMELSISARSGAAILVPVTRGCMLVGALILSVALAVLYAAGLAHEHAVGSRRAALPGVHERTLSSLPLSARGAVSGALGAESPVYRIIRSAGGFRTTNPTQRLAARFTRSGAWISSGSLRVGLSLRSAGYGPRTRAVARVSPHARANRVVYGRSGLSEWYVSGPLGIEQGFTVRRPPADPSGPLTLSMQLSGNAHPALQAGRQSVTFTGGHGEQLSYGSLRTTDARGRVLHSWLELHGRRIAVRVDARGARFPLRIDPLVQLEKLTGAGEVTSGRFGKSVAISSDGTTALIGGQGDNNFIGAAWVFERSSGAWKPGPKLTDTEVFSNGDFGWSVALSKDGNTALVGGTGVNNFVGAAWVFERKAGKWEETAKFEGAPSEEEKGEFGSSVALSSDGNTALVGGDADNKRKGAVWVFERSSSAEKWTPGPKLIANPEEGGGEFGESVALSSDGNTALVGVPKDENGFGLGSAWTFTRSGKEWKVLGEKYVRGKEEFGYGVALSANGTIALIGSARGSGAAYVLERSTGFWNEAATPLTGNGGFGEGHFGASVALSTDGNTALIGGLDDAQEVGAAWVFKKLGSTWSQQKLTAGGELGKAKFGKSVALSGEGNTAVVGGERDNIDLGAAWIFTILPVVSLGAPADETATTQTSPTFTWSASDEEGPGIAHVDFLLNDSRVAEFHEGQESFTPSLPEGNYTWQLRVVDKNGYTQTSPKRRISIDTTPPSAPALLAPGPGATVHQATPTFSWGASGDATSGVSNYSLVIDGSAAATLPAGACQQGVCSVVSPFGLGSGTHSWQVLASDRAGNRSSSATGVFTVPPAPPQGRVGVSIDEGDYAANTPHVVVDVVWPPFASELLISNDGGFNVQGTEQRPVASRIAWTLRSTGSERLPKIVYLRFPDSTNPTSTFTDDIILDRTTPLIRSARLLGARGGHGASAAARHSRYYRVRIGAHETVSGVSVVQISSRRALSAGAASGAVTRRLRPRTVQGLLNPTIVLNVRGSRPRYVRVQSAAGTWSRWHRLA
jgi:hypothetical protein